jgi:hypothetical protein
VHESRRTLHDAAGAPAQIVQIRTNARQPNRQPAGGADRWFLYTAGWQALNDVAAGLAGAGLPEQAANVAGQAVQAAAGVEDRWRANALSATAAALAGAGLAEQTWAVVDTAANVEDPRQQVEALSKVAEALVKAGLAGPSRGLAGPSRAGGASRCGHRRPEEEGQCTECPSNQFHGVRQQRA